MRRAIGAGLRIGILLAAGLAGGPAAAQGGGLCVVADPTGTPLNVRAAPGADILGQIGNGRDVEVLEERSDARGRMWALIRQPGAPAAMGWVFREFIRCGR